MRAMVSARSSERPRQKNSHDSSRSRVLSARPWTNCMPLRIGW